MSKKRITLIGAIILVIIGIVLALAVTYLKNDNTNVRIERAGVCNPLKPIKNKEVKTSNIEKKELKKYWKKTNKNKTPNKNEIIKTLIGDYKLFIEEDEILFNLDITYVSFNGKYITISKEFSDYISNIVRTNDVNLKQEEK